MSRYQVTFSVLCFAAIPIGLFGLISKFLNGMNDTVFWAYLLATLLVAAAMYVKRKQPMTDEAIFRLAGAPEWLALSPMRRMQMMWLDWPLFSKIREAEAQRLKVEPLTKVLFEADSLKLIPVDAQHRRRYFLKRIAEMTRVRGIQLRSSTNGFFWPKFFADKVELQWQGGDKRVWEHIKTKISDGEIISIRHFYDTLESGYLSTMSYEDQRNYMIGTR
ncbi:hypothetical protein [Sphingobium agri]|uniref:SMODS-associated NUDIX domain-containing protein n=1 Tax=Sphingobium agri TaxID=2933566 RepID=A0ABT0DU84_9SPHN|nr:hypothetical protein [Sphingobium agri]MCK0530686.1 hypothetical protein [Sphingobium agri]